MITAAHDGRRRIVAGANKAAQAIGITAGLPLASAQAMVPGLTILDAAPESDATALTALAVWCLRYAPLVAADPPDGLWIDVTGCTHLAAGEDALLPDLAARLDRAGFIASIAIADTPGAAHAAAHYGGRPIAVVAPDDGDAALAPLPIEALRLPEEICDGLRRVGLERVGDLMTAPRAPLVRRFGTALALRLAQARGEQFESIHPLMPPDVIERRVAFIEPLSTADAFAIVIDKLTRHVCRRLDHKGLGARRLDLLFERVDGSVQVIRIGAARPSHDAVHLARLLRERLEHVDPEGVEAMRLIAATTEPLEFAQIDALPRGEQTGMDGLAELIDRLINRFGTDRVYRVAPVESDVPERSFKHVPPLTPSSTALCSMTLPRPIRLLTPPQAVMVIAPLPDHPPASFIWRKQRHRIRRATGPERISGEWWKRDGELMAVRDYFAVEDETGQRFWLFRHGDGQDAATGDLSWFLHGFF